MKVRRYWIAASLLFVLFGLFTATVLVVDVQPIGPEGSAIGWAALNAFVHNLLGVNLLWYHITDWLGVIAMLVALGFAVLGIVQLIQRKSVRRVDKSILVLGGFYIVVVAAYIFFEMVVVNYRPILMDGALEASYPSSHTMIVLCIMGTASLQGHARIGNKKTRIGVDAVCAAIVAVTITGRLISGVHWFTDIVGGLLLGASLVGFYAAVVCQMEHFNKSLEPCKNKQQQ